MEILELIGDTPLVEVPGIDAEVPVLAKCEHLNPGGSIKDRIAKAIAEDAQARGLLQPGMTMVEATAGNTGLGLALVAAAMDLSLVCVMPEKMAHAKRRALAAVGAKLFITPNAPPSSPENFQQVARRLAEDNGWFLTDQFENPANIKVHAEETAQEIIEQVAGPIGAFVCGAGTGGTISGVGQRLKAIDARTRIILADPVGSSYARWVETGKLGPDGPYAVEGIGGSQPPKNLNREVIDGAESISDEETFETARALIRAGLMVGGSAGANVAAAARVARRKDLIGPVVTVLPDGWDRYFGTPWLEV